MTSAAQIPPAWPALLSREQLCAYLGGLSDATVRKICPVAPIDLGANVLRYRRSEIDRWLDGCAARLPREKSEPQDGAAPAVANDRPAMTPGERARARAQGRR